MCGAGLTKSGLRIATTYTTMSIYTTLYTTRYIDTQYTQYTRYTLTSDSNPLIKTVLVSRNTITYIKYFIRFGLINT